MNSKNLSASRAKQILSAATKSRVLVVGDVMLDQFIWGSVGRISPEAPVPVLDFERESFMPGGAANVARNLRRDRKRRRRAAIEKTSGRAKNRLRRIDFKFLTPHKRQDAHRGAQTAGRAH
jgi:hypothetical protein